MYTHTYTLHSLTCLYLTTTTITSHSRSCCGNSINYQLLTYCSPHIQTYQYLTQVPRQHVQYYLHNHRHHSGHKCQTRDTPHLRSSRIVWICEFWLLIINVSRSTMVHGIYYADGSPSSSSILTSDKVLVSDTSLIESWIFQVRRPVAATYSLTSSAIVGMVLLVLVPHSLK
jgi:hypothetical protein